jgi:L-alanine-DL-glutamate epimerase-like enolase superfamily enzyme
MIIKDIIGYGLSSPCIDESVRYLGYLGNSNLKNIGIIEVHTDSGHVGIGETYAGVYAAEVIEPTVSFLKQRLIGMEVANYHDVSDAIYRIPYIGRSGLFSSISSAIDIALLDIVSRVEEKPIYKYLNNEGIKSVRAYASNGSSMFTPNQIKDDVISIKNMGFTAYKMRVGYQDWDSDIKRIEAAKNELENNDIMFDSIMGTLKEPWSQNFAEKRIMEMMQFQPKWIEEPVHPENIEAMSYLNREFPIAGGEALTGLKEFMEYKKSKCVTFAQPDATHCGGITKCLSIVNMFPRNALHVWGSSAAFMANLHVALASNVEIIEYPMMRLEVSKEIQEYKLEWDGDKIMPPEHPGLGIKITEEVKRKYKLVRDSNYII